MSLVDSLHDPSGRPDPPGAPSPTAKPTQLAEAQLNFSSSEVSPISSTFGRPVEETAVPTNIAGAAERDAFTLTLTKTTNLANEDSGQGGVTTVTRLTTQTGGGGGEDGGVPAAATSLVVSDGGGAGEQGAIGNPGDTPSTAQASRSSGLTTSSVTISRIVTAATAQDSSGINGTAVPVEPSPTSTPNPILATATLDGNDDPDLVSTFVITTGQPKTMMEIQTSLPPISTGANNRAAANDNSSSASSNIFASNNKLFPLGIAVIVLGSLFLLAALGVLFLRLFGWNRKRKLRRLTTSFIEIGNGGYGSRGGTMFDPKFEKFDTITTNRAPKLDLDSSNPFEPFNSDSDTPRADENGYAGVGIYSGRALALRHDIDGRYPSVPSTTPAQDQRYHALERGTMAPLAALYSRPEVPARPNYTTDIFANPHRAPGLDVPRDVDNGSPVPSFISGRTPYPLLRPKVYTTNPDDPSTPGSRLGRTLTNSSRGSGSSEGGGRQGDRILGSNPEQGGTGYLSMKRLKRLSSGSVGFSDGGSVYSSSSGESERISETTKSRVMYPASGAMPINGSRKLGKKAVWGSDRI